MIKSPLLQKLIQRDITITFQHILDNSKADSGGERDVSFLKYLVDTGLLILSEAVLKRTNMDSPEEYYLERYKKASYESDRHFLCRTMIQDELNKMGIETLGSLDIGNMNILRSNSSYDIVTEDFSSIIDIGLTPARNYFRGLTDLKVRNYFITTYFDDYIDDVIFSVFSRYDDKAYLDVLRDYEEGFKDYIPSSMIHLQSRQYTTKEEL